MGDNRGAQPTGGGDEAVARRGASRERQTRGLSVDGAAGSAESRSWGQEPSADTLQRALSLLMERVELEPEAAALCYLVCAPWRRELEARGFCNKTVRLCSALAGGMGVGRLGQIAQRRLDGSEDERTRCVEACEFLQGSSGWKGSLHAWLQAASQEPDASFLSRGASSTAQCLGVQLLQWAGKPQGIRGVARGCSLTDHSSRVTSVAISPDGKRVVSGSADNFVKIWNAETGAVVSILFECVEGGGVRGLFAGSICCRICVGRGLSHRMYLLISFRKSAPPQNRQLSVYYY